MQMATVALIAQQDDQFVGGLPQPLMITRCGVGPVRLTQVTKRFGAHTAVYDITGLSYDYDPGGNITGLCGYNAASVVAADAGVQRWWPEIAPMDP